MTAGEDREICRDGGKRRLPDVEWMALNRQILDCQSCPRLIEHCLSVAEQKRAAYRDETYWGRPVPNFGDACARLLIVGLAPGAHGANRTGRMFTGDRSGDWLFRALSKTGFASQGSSVSIDDGLTLTDCAITNACHCAPPGNKPTTEEIRNCAPWFEQLLRQLPVKVIVALGGLAWNTCVAQIPPRTGSSAAEKKKPRFGHGAEARLESDLFPTGEVMLLGSYHPSQQNTFTRRLTEPMLDGVFRRAQQLLFGGSRAGRGL